MIENLDPDSPWAWLLKGLLELSRWARLALVWRRRPPQGSIDGKEGEKR